MTIGWPRPHSPSSMNDGLDQATEKNQSGDGRCAPVRRSLTIPVAGLNSQTKIMHEATIGTIEGM